MQVSKKFPGASIDAIVYMGYLLKKSKDVALFVPNFTLEEILYDVCDIFKLEKEDIMGHRRSREICIPRMIFSYVASSICKHRVTHIGRFLSERDHTTIVHHKRTAAYLLDVQEWEFMRYWNFYLKETKVYFNNNKAATA